ncbi:MAG: hypothetical protein JWO02_3952 [Solirubrobacterales bacterium]|nr:hypothetical protein [Solirubrobacterales bacterium]
MVINGIIRRFDLLRGTKVRAIGGIRLGASEDDVRAVFGARAVRTQHAYVPDGSYLTVGYARGPYKGRGIRFETDADGEVTSIHAGRSQEIRYIEGCA